jgi:hypothetical protein
VLALEHNHPIEFAKEHPFYTKMFDDPVMLDKLIDRWEAHEQRFEYWHDCLWKVLDGYVASHPELPAPAPGNPTEIAGSGPNDRNGSSPESLGPAGGPGGGGVSTAAVPEPSSGLLIVLGLLGSGSWLVLRVRLTRTS